MLKKLRKWLEGPTVLCDCGGKIYRGVTVDHHCDKCRKTITEAEFKKRLAVKMR
jgi:hypothetical protein